MSRNKFRGHRSRKWFLVLLIITIATLGTFIPPMVSAWIFGEPKPLIILSGTEWVSVIGMIVAAYITGNVFQKHVEANALVTTGVTKTTSKTSTMGSTTTEAVTVNEEGEH